MTREDLIVMVAALLVKRCDEAISALQSVRCAALSARETGAFDRAQMEDAIERARRSGLFGWLWSIVTD